MYVCILCTYQTSIILRLRFSDNTGYKVYDSPCRSGAWDAGQPGLRGAGGPGGGSPVLGLAAARAARRPAARLLLAARERAHHLHTARPGQRRRRRRRPDRQLSSQSCRSGLNAALRNGMTRLDVIVPGRSRNKQSLAVLTGDPTGNTR